MAKTDIRLDIWPDNRAKYGRIITKVLFVPIDDITTIHTEFYPILSISVDKENIRLDMRPDIRIIIFLSDFFQNDIIQTCIKFHANPLNIQKVNRPDIRLDIRIITKI